MGKWFLVITIALVALVVSSSCIQSRPPAPVPQSIPKSSPSPSTPTLPPEIEKGLLILSYSTYVDDSGHLHVVGEIQNVGSKNTELNEVTVTFFGQEGAPVVAASNYSYLDILVPDQKSPFEVIFSSPPHTINYSLKTRWQTTTRESYLSMTNKTISWQMTKEGWGELVGELTNTGNETMDVIVVIGTFYDKNGKVVGASMTFPDLSPLKPNVTSSFTMMVDSKIASAMETYSVQTEGHKKDLLR